MSSILTWSSENFSELSGVSILLLKSFLIANITFSLMPIAWVFHMLL